MKDGKSDIRRELTPSQLVTPVRYTIDPGFVNRRMVQSTLGPVMMNAVDQQVRQIPNLAAWETVRIDHILTQALLLWCRERTVKTLEEALVTPGERFFCSNEKLGPWHDEPGDPKRAVSLWVPRSHSAWQVEFHYSRSHVQADTLRWFLQKGPERLAIVAELCSASEETVIVRPIVMGFPLVEAADQALNNSLMYCRDDFYRTYLDEFDEFAKMKNTPTPGDPKPMEKIAEAAFKACLAEILGDQSPSDWGGENRDYFSDHLHINGVRMSGEFLLKGPARFTPMRLRHLGKNHDQILRLSHGPADVLFVQHCHDIGPEVRETLRVFATQPCNPRRYCLIDGRDSLRLLRAYGLYEKAVEMSRQEKGKRRSRNC